VASSKKPSKESLELDVQALRARLGPVKVRLIEQWIREVNGPMDALIAGAMYGDACVLDIGCSRGDPDLPSMYTGRRTSSAPMSTFRGYARTTWRRACVLAGARNLPFANGSFDLVVCKWVAEHLEDPALEFRECARVLRPGGVLVLLTPNAWSFFTLLSRMLPYRLKQIFKGRLFAGHEEDTFRTWYRANSPSAQLDLLMHRAGLGPRSFRLLPGMWTFFIFSEPLARFVRGCERLQLKIPGLRAATTYILAAYEKPQI
jgi:SAM-dependent methyltransferase